MQWNSSESRTREEYASKKRGGGNSCVYQEPVFLSCRGSSLRLLGGAAPRRQQNKTASQKTNARENKNKKKGVRVQKVALTDSQSQIRRRLQIDGKTNWDSMISMMVQAARCAVDSIYVDCPVPCSEAAAAGAGAAAEGAGAAAVAAGGWAVVVCACAGLLCSSCCCASISCCTC